MAAFFAESLERSAALVTVASGIVLAALLGIFTQLSQHQGPYFPTSAADPPNRLDADLITDYEKHLSAMREPSLWRLSQTEKTAIAVLSEEAIGVRGVNNELRIRPLSSVEIA